jgi:hypothetical protein
VVKGRVTAAVLENLERLKTCALIMTAARVGAIIGGAARKDLDRITRYAQALGLAFQITDDILDRDEVSGDKDDSKGLISTISRWQGRQWLPQGLKICCKTACEKCSHTAARPNPCGRWHGMLL